MIFCSKEKTAPKFAWRKNVLMLFLMGYALLAIIFCCLVFGANMTIDNAYQLIDAPVMALIGGSIAISKDLIEGDNPSPSPPKPLKGINEGDKSPPEPPKNT